MLLERLIMLMHTLNHGLGLPLCCTFTRHLGEAGHWELVSPSAQDGHSHSKHFPIDEPMADVCENVRHTGLNVLLRSKRARFNTRPTDTKYRSEIKLHQDKRRVVCIMLSSKVWIHYLWYDIKYTHNESNSEGDHFYCDMYAEETSFSYCTLHRNMTPSPSHTQPSTSHSSSEQWYSAPYWKNKYICISVHGEDTASLPSDWTRLHCAADPMYKCSIMAGSKPRYPIVSVAQ